MMKIERILSNLHKCSGEDNKCAGYGFATGSLCWTLLTFTPNLSSVQTTSLLHLDLGTEASLWKCLGKTNKCSNTETI